MMLVVAGCWCYKDSMKKIRNLTVGLAVLVLVALSSFRLGEKYQAKKSGEQGKLDLSLMWQVKDRLGEKFLEREKIDDQKMVYGAVSGMVSSLDDPYTMFLPPKENKSANEDLTGEFGGVGIQLGYKEKTLAVMTPLAKTPADVAGILAGDLILKIIDKNKKIDRETTGISLTEAVELIRGEIGTEVTLKLYREGKAEAFEVTLKRDNIVVPSLELEWVERNGKKFAWVKLYKFSERVYSEWPEMVDKILGQKNDGIILDLRNNPGGYLQASVLVGSDFIRDGVITVQKSTMGADEKYFVDKSRKKLLDNKLVVLVNGGSASAAEILAGALKEYGRGKLVGEKTFGKGTVQQPEDFADGSGLHVTVAKWLLPSGKNIHGEGVMPDVEVKYVKDEKDPKADNQLEKAIEELIK